MNKILFSFVIVLIVFACELPEQQRGVVNSSNYTPDQIADSVDVIYSEAGLIKMKLKAPILVMKNDSLGKVNEFTDGVEITFYNKEGAENSIVTSKYGYDNSSKRERYIRDSVVITDLKSGAIYRTHELFIDERKDSVHNNGGKVKITKPDGTVVNGTGFYSDTRMEKIKIKRVTNSTVFFEDEELNNTLEPDQPIEDK